MPISLVDKRRPFSHYQIALVLLALLPMIVAFGLMAWWQSRALRDSIDHGMLRTADALSLAVDREVGTIRAGLETLADSDTIDRNDMASFYQEAVRAAERRPGSWIVLIESSGQYLVNTSVPFGTPLPNRFREEIASSRPNELSTSVVPYAKQVLVTGRANNSQLFMSIAQKRPVLAINVPVVRKGAVSHVLSITFPPERLAELLLAGLYDKQGGSALLDGNGFVIARSREPEAFIGKKAIAELRIPPEAPARGVGPGKTLDGRPIYRAYSRSPVTGWLVSTGVIQGDLERAVAADLFRTALVGLVGLVIGVLLALWFTYRLRAPMTALAAKASGKPVNTAPEGFTPAEFVELGRAIDAGSRAREAEAAERELRVAAEARKDEADAANRAKDQFLAMLGHELRNPLAAISNAVTVMERSPAASPSMTPIVKRQSEHLRKLVDDLLDVARVTSGKVRLVLENVDLYELAAACLDNFVRTGRGASHELTLTGASVSIHADRHRMTQVVTNLLDNALKFTPPGGRITLSVVQEDHEAVLRVADTGAGIADEALSRIFDVFAQGDQPPERAHGGLGLGLALAKSLVEAQHGRINAESEGPGRGATFTVRMARVLEQDRAGEDGSILERTPDAQKRRVLLVEDQVDTRNALRSLLELHGHEVREAVDGRSAIAAAQSHLPDVAFVDLGLPDIDGFGVARALRSNAALRGIRLVALTGYGLPDDREKAMQAGFDAFIIKPLEERALKEALSGGR